MFYDEYEDRPATPADACREFARNVGAEDPEREWISTPFDSWERNPFYHGVWHVDPETANSMRDSAEADGIILTEDDLRVGNFKPRDFVEDDIPF